MDEYRAYQAIEKMSGLDVAQKKRAYEKYLRASGWTKRKAKAEVSRRFVWAKMTLNCGNRPI